MEPGAPSPPERSLEAITRPVHAAAPWAEDWFSVGVTGTNGKTSTTLLVAEVLRAAGQRVVAETTLGFGLEQGEFRPREVGRFIERMRGAAELGVRHAALEVTSEALASGWARRWRFDLGVFTNLSQDHLDAHHTFEHYLASKAQLFVHLGPGRSAVLNASDPVAHLIDRVTPPDVRRLWFAAPSRGPALTAPDLAARAVDLSPDGTHIELEPSELAGALGGVLDVALVGPVFAENTLAAACAALAMGIEPAVVRRGLSALTGVPGRFEVVSRAPVVAVDYAHTPDALARTCDTARELAGGARVIVVFGAGGNRDPSKRRPMGEAVGARADVAVVTSDNPRDEDPRAIAREVEAGCRRGGRALVLLEADRRAAIVRALELARAADVIVVAGKGHETGQTIRGETSPFDDAAVVRGELAGRGGSGG